MVFRKQGRAGDFVYVMIQHVARIMKKLGKLVRMTSQMDMIDGIAHAAIAKLVGSSIMLQAVPTLAAFMPAGAKAGSKGRSQRPGPHGNNATTKS